MNWILVLLPVLAILILLPPLFRPGRDTAAERESRIDTLRERRRALIGAIRELDFDRQMGKLSEEDHAEQRTRMKDEAARVIRRIEAEEAKGRG